MGRSSQIDLLKALSIISVIILHSVTDQTMRNQLGIPFLVLQAVPIFMIIMGFNNSMSYMKHNAITLKEIYTWSLLKHRLDRILWVFMFAVTLEALVAVFINNIKFIDIMLLYLQGGVGPGSYFVPVMIQTLIVLPVLYISANKNANFMLLSAFIVNMAFEIYAYKYCMSNEVYRLLFPRYLFAVALGVWIVKIKNVKWPAVIIGAVISLIYITSVHYFGLINMYPVQPDWLSQNAPAYLWPFAIFLFGIKILPAQASGILEYFAKVGRASYHIFLVQMVYFWTASGLMKGKMPMIIFIVINLCICLIAGYVFYLSEQGVRLYLKSKKTLSS